MGRRYRDLCRLSTRLVTMAAESEEGYTIVKEGLINLFRDLDLKSAKRNEQPSLDNNRIEEEDGSLDMPIDSARTTKIIRGIKFKPKSGSKSSRRPKSALEKATKKNTRSHKARKHMLMIFLVLRVVIWSNTQFLLTLHWIMAILLE